MNLFKSLRSVPHATAVRDTSYSFDEYLGLLQYQGLNYPLGLNPTYQPNVEEISSGFAGYSRTVLKRNGIVWACNLKRMQLFGETRYGFRRVRSGIPGEMFGTEALAVLENPQPGRQTRDMNKRLIQDVDLAGNSYLVPRTFQTGGERRTELRRPRPDWSKVLLGTNDDFVDGDDPTDLDLTPLYLAYYPGGDFTGQPVMIPYREVAHWKPYPDPDQQWLGMSWITPIVRQVQSYDSAVNHKTQYWNNAATPNLMVKLDISDVIKFREWVDEFERNHRGTANAYKTLFLGAGADPTVIGGTMKDMDMSAATGIDRNDIVMAAGLTATLLGTTEGLSGSSLNAGNYNSSRRSTADTTLADLLGSACQALSAVVAVPSDAELWYHAETIPFLQEDMADRAEIQSKQAAAIRQLVDGGYTPDSVVLAVQANDLSLLVHSGKLSVQLQEQEQ